MYFLRFSLIYSNKFLYPETSDFQYVFSICLVVKLREDENKSLFVVVLKSDGVRKPGINFSLTFSLLNFVVPLEIRKVLMSNHVLTINQNMIMKKLLLLTGFLVALVFYAKAQSSDIKIESGDPSSMAKFQWNETTHNFGKIDQGTPVTVEFEFTNTGKTPLVISNVKGSCGCTVTDYTKQPVPPGKKGIVKATYNAAAFGAFNKSIRVTANVEGGTEMLFIKGEVVKKTQ